MERDKLDYISIQGYSHILTEKECQDCSIGWQSDRYDAIIVCDGHGGDKYIRSAKGSMFACQAGKELITQFMAALDRDKKVYESFLSDCDKRDNMFRQLERSIIQKWQDTLLIDISENPLQSDPRYPALEEKDKKSINNSPAKAYGSTFICAVLTDSFYFVLKLGDGNVCALARNKRVDLLDKQRSELQDDDLQFNITTSLCNSDADQVFKHYFAKLSDYRDIQGLLLSTDGVINSFEAEKNYLNFIGNIFDDYYTRVRKDAHEELAKYLPTLSQKGSGDDLSIAIIRRKPEK